MKKEDSKSEYDKPTFAGPVFVIGVQVNGVFRAEIAVMKDEDESSVKEKTLKLPKLQKWLDQGEVRKFIYVPNTIVNVIVK